jgi:hypothetical protein
MTVKVRCEITILEIDGRAVDTNTKDKPVLVMESDWRGVSHPNMILTVGGKKYTVPEVDVARAVYAVEGARKL